MGEWVDVKNTGTESVRFNVMALTHTLFNDYCQVTGRQETYWTGGGTNELRAGKIVRIHTGHKSDEHLMNANDRVGCDWHGYADSDRFKLNNKCGDTIIVTWQDAYGRTLQDAAQYDKNVPEGVILVRSGSKLVQATGYGR